MAVVSKKSTIITNRDSVPTLLTDPQVSGGTDRYGLGYATITSGDSIGSLYTLTQVPSNCRVVEVKLACEAIGTSATCSIGVFKTTYNGGGIAFTGSDTFFASAQSIASAINPPVTVVNQSGTNTIAKQEQPLWQAIGLAADPETMFDITITLTGAAATSTGNVQIQMDFIQ